MDSVAEPDDAPAVGLPGGAAERDVAERRLFTL
jgi:hypothetical protein